MGDLIGTNVGLGVLAAVALSVAAVTVGIRAFHRRSLTTAHTARDRRQVGSVPMLDKDLETRVAGHEHEVVRLREDAASARALAALADRDVAEFRTQLRGHHQVLSALRETQLEQGQKIEEQGRKIEEQGREMREIRREMREGFSTLATGMAQITTLLTIAESESDGS